MKAKNTDLIEKTPTKKPKKLPVLLKPDQISKNFGVLQKSITEFEEISNKIEISDNEVLAIAENNSSLIQQTLNNIELSRKTMKQPYYDTGQAIDAYAKTLQDPLNRAKKRLNDKIANYKILQRQAETAEAQRKEKERQEYENERNSEIERLAKIRKQINARIYGGVYYAKDGTRKTSAGCIKPEDCDELMKIFVDKLPKPESFKHLKAEMEDASADATKLLIEHRKNLVDKNTEAINNAKVKAEVEVMDDEDTQKHDLKKSISSDVKATEKKIKEAGKGVRELLKFTISSEAEVPADFKVVDEGKVREYMNANKDRIKNMLKEGQQPIPGIQFYVDTSFVSQG